MPDWPDLGIDVLAVEIEEYVTAATEAAFRLRAGREPDLSTPLARSMYRDIVAADCRLKLDRMRARVRH